MNSSRKARAGLVAAVVVLAAAGCGSSEPAVVMPAEITAGEATNPAAWSFMAKVENPTSGPVTASCTVRAQDPSGAYKGWDVFTSVEPIAAGDTLVFSGVLTITDEGAPYVTESTIECEVD